MIWGGVFSQITAGQQFSLGQQAGFFILGNLVFLALHGYLLAKHGQTIGKKVVGTRIVGLDGQHIPFGKMYFVRYFLPSLIAQLPFLGGIFGLVDALFVFRKDKRCIHDLMAGTQVVDV